MALDVRVPSGHEGAAAGCADGSLYKGISEGDRFCGDKFVEVWCLYGGIAEVSHDIPAPLVGVEYDYVGSGSHGDLPDSDRMMHHDRGGTRLQKEATHLQSVRSQLDAASQ